MGEGQSDHRRHGARPLRGPPALCYVHSNNEFLTVIILRILQITFGFFANRKPTVQLLVNGEPVLSAINSASYVMHHSSGRLTAVGQHPEGNITGLTMIDFLALPAHARLAISYSGEEGAEGFMGLRKLA